MEGVKRYCVRLLTHNEQWKEEFQKQTVLGYRSGESGGG